MSFFNDLLDKARGLLGRKAEPVKYTDAVPHDRFDAMIFNELLDEAPALADLADELNGRYDYTDDLLRDTLMQFWQGDPQLRDAKDMETGHLVNHGVATDISTSPQLAQARQYTQHDKYSAAMATIGVGDRVRELLAEHKDAIDAAQEAEEQAQADQAAQDALMQALAQAEACGMPPIGPPSPAQQAAQQALADAAAAAEAAAQAAAQADDAARNEAATMQARIQAAVNNAIGDAVDELEDEAELFRAWGVDDGQLQQMSFEERANYAQMLRNSRFAKFQKLIGRFKIMQAAQRTRRVEYGRDEVVGTELSGDLARMVPTELVGYVNKSLRRDFLLRLTEGRLLSRQYKGVEQVGQGAIIACIDTSGSMTTEDNNGVTREAWAKAFALALLDQARQGKRDFVAINFSNRRQQTVHRFPRGQGRIEDVITFVEEFYGGGTDFAKPMDLAMDVLEDEFNTDGKMKGDIVFITDDECGVTPEWMASYQARKHRLGFRTFGIAVGTGYGQVLDAMSDNVRSITEFADPDVVADILRVVH